jgi:UDP-N-acetylglucosamine 4,6-dehydratase/5-epimerase
MMMNATFLEPQPDLTGRSVLVTGGTGSFGRAFVHALLKHHKPKRLVVFSRDEQKQDAMMRELQAAYSRETFECMRFFIGDVRDASRLELAMRGIDIVVHAAALKIVPTAEYNPFECILTNVHGAENVVKASLRAKVRQVIALSTDKAVNPINLYGASKLAADKIMVAANYLAGGEPPHFSVVRYGNVIGSRGSVVPLFESLVKRGAKAIPITDPRMTRFWITLEQGVNFVLSSLEMMRGAEIFVPKIPSMNIADLANAIAPGLPHQVIGIRPGEKLHEVLVTEDDARMTLELDDRYVICPPIPEPEWTARHLEALGARPVPEGLVYSSDRNLQRLDKFGLMRLTGRDRSAVA